MNNEEEGIPVAPFILSGVSFMRRFLQRSIVLAFVFLALLALAAGISSVRSAPLDELRIDWATYNPVSIVTAPGARRSPRAVSSPA